VLPVPEQLWLAALTVVSAALFAKGFTPEIRAILDGSPDSPRTDHIAHRLARVIREVLLQTKVVSGRLIVGTLHAIVFYGFLLTRSTQHVT
jgi:hypothetical protein